MKRISWVPLKGYPRITQSQIIVLTYPGLCKSGYLIPTYPGICKCKHLIPTYPGLSQSTKSIPGYPGLSWFAQGVVFPVQVMQGSRKNWKKHNLSTDHYGESRLVFWAKWLGITRALVIGFYTLKKLFYSLKRSLPRLVSAWLSENGSSFELYHGHSNDLSCDWKFRLKMGFELHCRSTLSSWSLSI